MTTITKERIELFIKNPLDNGLTRSEQMELARIALASLEAEPLCYLTWHQGFRAPDDCEEYVVEAKPGDKSCDGTPAFPVYTAPPVPVSVPTFEKWCELTEQKPVGWVRDAMKEAYDACRSAMLQGADGKPELTVWYGSMPETNGKTNWTAMLHRKGQHPWEGITIERSEHPDRVRYKSDRMRHLIGELSEEPDILEYDADAHSGYVKPGNSPVTPDGWISCSERMPEDGQHVIILCDGAFVLYAQHRDGEFFDVVRDGDEFFETQSRNVTHWMPLPEPPQEAK